MRRRLPRFEYDILAAMIGRHGLQNVVTTIADICRETAEDGTSVMPQWLTSAAVLEDAAMELPPKHEAKRKVRAQLPGQARVLHT